MSENFFLSFSPVGRMVGSHRFSPTLSLFYFSLFHFFSLFFKITSSRCVWWFFWLHRKTAMREKTVSERVIERESGLEKGQKLCMQSLREVKLDCGWRGGGGGGVKGQV